MNFLKMIIFEYNNLMFESGRISAHTSSLQRVHFKIIIVIDLSTTEISLIMQCVSSNQINSSIIWRNYRQVVPDCLCSENQNLKKFNRIQVSGLLLALIYIETEKCTLARVTSQKHSVLHRGAFLVIQEKVIIQGQNNDFCKIFHFLTNLTSYLSLEVKI